jgi:hypothetical protein
MPAGDRSWKWSGGRDRSHNAEYASLRGGAAGVILGPTARERGDARLAGHDDAGGDGVVATVGG